MRKWYAIASRFQLHNTNTPYYSHCLCRPFQVAAANTDSSLAQGSSYTYTSVSSSITSFSSKAVGHGTIYKRLPAFQPQHTVHIFKPLRPSPFRGWDQHTGHLNQRFSHTTARNKKPSRDKPDQCGKSLQLIRLGFTEQQASRVLSFFTRRGVSLSIENVHAWLQLLHQLHVDQTVCVVSRHPIILTSRAATAAANAAGVKEWLCSVGATPETQAMLFGKYPMLLNIPHATTMAMTEWLRRELMWSSSTITRVLLMYPELFTCSWGNLDVKLAWLLSSGASVQMLNQKPYLLLNNFNSKVNQAKVRFLSQVMKLEVLPCIPFLGHSLLERIGPRYTFHSLHCSGQPFTLSYRLCSVDADFVKQLISPSLESECASSSQTRLQVYEKFRFQWQQGEGRQWDVGKGEAKKKRVEKSCGKGGD